MDGDALQIITAGLAAVTSVGVASLWVGLGSRLGKVETEQKAARDSLQEGIEGIKSQIRGQREIMDDNIAACKAREEAEIKALAEKEMTCKEARVCKEGDHETRLRTLEHQS